MTSATIEVYIGWKLLFHGRGNETFDMDNFSGM